MPTPRSSTSSSPRTPYAVAFISHGMNFILTTVHIIWDKGAKQRTPEIAAIADWLKDWSTRADTVGFDLPLVGDFNIDREGDANFDALTATGLTTPPELDAVARTVTSLDGAAGTFDDQIAWFPKKLKLHYMGRSREIAAMEIEDPDQDRSHRGHLPDFGPLSAVGRVRRQRHPAVRTASRSGVADAGDDEPQAASAYLQRRGEIPEPGLLAPADCDAQRRTPSSEQTEFVLTRKIWLARPVLGRF